MANQLRMGLHQKKKKRLQYTPDSMETAIRMVREGVMSKKRASIIYGIPRTTLLDKLAGRVPEGPTKPGVKPIFSEAEEKIFVSYIIRMSDIGYPLSKQHVQTEAKCILDKDGRSNPFKDNRPGKFCTWIKLKTFLTFYMVQIF